MALFKNIIVYRIGPEWTPPDPAALEDELQRLAFVPCHPTQQQSSGWAPPRGEENGIMAETVGGQLIFKLMVERKSVPASAVRNELEARCKAIEAERGRKPGRKEKTEIKDEIVLTLLPRAFSKRGASMLWLDAERRMLVVGAGSVKGAELPVKQLVDVMATLGHVLPLSLPSTAMAPATAMAHWLTTKEPPWGFTIDRDLELKKPGEERSVVRYARHTLELDEIGQHIQEGKLPTQLALTWDDRVSFSLTDQLCIRKVDLRNVDKKEGGKKADFDGDVALTTGELRQMIPDLMEALGGETDPAAGPAAAPTAPAPATESAGDALPWEDAPTAA